MNEIINKIRTEIKLLRLDNETGSGYINADTARQNKEFAQVLREIYKLVYEKRDALTSQRKYIDKEIEGYKTKIAYQASEICRLKAYYKKKIEQLNI